MYLASTSPRRRELANELSFQIESGPSGVDDGPLEPGQAEPEAWVMALAYLKAVAGARTVAHAEPAYDAVIGADTVCVCPNGLVIGQPADADDARRMIRGFVNRSHRVLTGIAIVQPGTPRRELFVDVATVTLGEVSGAEIDAYVESGNWAGKAGGYNYSERLAAGWPLSCAGDPKSVMGLPVGRLNRRLGAFLANTTTVRIDRTGSGVIGTDLGGEVADSAGSTGRARGTVGA